jgi:hypothetical protein
MWRCEDRSISDMGSNQKGRSLAGQRAMVCNLDAQSLVIAVSARAAESLRRSWVWQSPMAQIHNGVNLRTVPAAGEFMVASRLDEICCASTHANSFTAPEA